MEPTNIFDANKWGLPSEATADLAERLYRFYERYHPCFRTITGSRSEYPYNYMSGLLRMKDQRNFAKIGREAGVAEQNMQHFMSNSPWSAQEVLRQVRAEIAGARSLSRGGVLILDESAEEKAGEKSVGAARQYNGRLGKVEMSQVGVFLAYANLKGPAAIWTWIDGELFLPENWFTPEMAVERERLGLPPERIFQTKIELGLQMILRVQAGQLPFEAVACDELYGRSRKFRAQLREAAIVYMAAVPLNTEIYLECPEVGVPVAQPGQRGRPPTQSRVLSSDSPVAVQVIGSRATTDWKRILVRPIERGELKDRFAAQRVWTLWEGQPVEEWLVIRIACDGKRSYFLSNAPANTPIERLAWLCCQRYFVEQCNQEAKAEIGWDEFRAQKYSAWEHHLALTILTCWFIAQTKLEWAQKYPREPGLAAFLGVDVLPGLSMANIRELLRSVLPLRQLTPEGARSLVANHLVNRTRSRKSRIRNHATAPT